MKRLTDVGAFLVVSVLFLLGIVIMHSNQSDKLDEVATLIRNDETMVLRKGMNEKKLADFLYDRDYMQDKSDALLVASWLKQKMEVKGTPKNLGALNTPAYKIPVSVILANHNSQEETELIQRVNDDNIRLGVTADVDSMQGRNIPSSITQVGPTVPITVTVLSDSTKMPVPDVLVRIKEHYVDTASVVTYSYVEQEQKDSIVGYAKTDAEGKVVFNMTEGKHYSVLPVRNGYEFGVSRGTRGGALTEGLNYTFKCKAHVITPLSSTQYQRIKRESALVVRTPAEYNDMMYGAAVMFLVGWWTLLILIKLVEARSKRKSDHFMLVLLMILTAFGQLAMFSIPQPLTDMPIGTDTSYGIVVGLVGLFLLSNINFIKFYAGQSKLQFGKVHFDFVAQIFTLIPGVKGLVDSCSSRMKKAGWNMPEGVGYLFVALGFVVLLSLFGHGPEGSDAKVNLFFFQPSEISKYLVVVFIASFFTANASRLQEFADHKITKLTVKRRAQIVVLMALMFLLLCVLYIVVLSDMGPALVLLVTFLLLYSVARKDMPQMFVGIISFIVLLVIANMMHFGVWLSLCIALLWFAAWIAYGLVVKKQIYESALLFNGLILMFVYGGDILTALGRHEGARLSNRMAMAWSGVWNNEVEGGDQVVQGLWSLASGGMTGQGLGQGNPAIVPASYTDMVFTGMGEIMGWFALVIIIICFTMLVHRALLLGRREGHPFAFFLTSGMALVVGVQFLVIVLGSIGLIPLTGVSVPFLSYGKSSLIINLAAFGVLLSLSRYRATQSQQENVKKYDNVIVAGTLSFLAVSALIVCTLFNYQVWNRNEILLRPAFVTNTLGDRVAEYNPRINILIDKMDIGNIYDRNGILLASSSADTIRTQMNRYIGVGLNEADLRNETRKRKRRYYPFAEHTLFMLGDYNTRTVWGYDDGDPIGFVAESRYVEDLRGFSSTAYDEYGEKETVELETDKYRESPFAPPVTKSKTCVIRDYSILLPYLKSGNVKEMIDEFNAKREERDITLTLDAHLQKALQDNMADFFANEARGNEFYKYHLRASAVVLNAFTGDLLCSANYPLPNQDKIEMLRKSRIFKDAPSEMIPGELPITERDLGMTYQTAPGSTAKVMSAISGLMKEGVNASRKTYFVYNDEAVEYNGAGASIEPTGDVTMRDAIVKSSNCYFINLVHDMDTYPQLYQLYSAVGARLHPETQRSITPYYLYIGERNVSSDFQALVDRVQAEGKLRYDNYVGIKRAQKHEHMNWAQTAHAWGQGALYATPLNMARVASIVANGGRLCSTRYLLKKGQQTIESDTTITLMQADAARELKGFMQQESDKHRRNRHPLPGNPNNNTRMGGKTGTPERACNSDRLQGFSVKNPRNFKPNDAWYIFFINSQKENAPLAVAVRIERSHNKLSSMAVDFSAKCVIPSLNQVGYNVQ